MMKAYRIPDPFTLREIGEMRKAGSVYASASVWNADRNRHDGISKWDDDFLLVFTSEGRNRKAEVIRLNTTESRQCVCVLKYNAALEYARQKLYVCKDFSGMMPVNG